MSPVVVSPLEVLNSFGKKLLCCLQRNQSPNLRAEMILNSSISPTVRYKYQETGTQKNAEGLMLL